MLLIPIPAITNDDLSVTGLEGAAARGVLAKLLETNSNIVETVTFSKDGQILSVECQGCFEDSEGADIGSQDLLSAHSAGKFQ